MTNRPKAFVRQSEGQWVDDWAFAAYQGFRDLGFDVVPFDDWHSVRLRPEDVFVGYVEDTVAILEHYGFEVPKPMLIPRELKTFVGGRRVWAEKLVNFRATAEVPVFVKSAEKHKDDEFLSGVLTAQSSIDTFNSTADPEMMVMASEYIEMVSEYRCFVHGGKIVGIKHYSGDMFVFPNITTIRLIEYAISDIPLASFTVDIAVADKNDMTVETVVVECNDAWSVANYGLDSKTYAKFLRDRWYQIARPKEATS